jgi:AMP-polyphosphate phosphotransferase
MSELKEKLKTYEMRVNELQRELINKNIPMIITIDGLISSGKGTLINKLGLSLDARGFNIYSTQKENRDEKYKPFLYRFWENIPSAGRIKIFEKSWYYALLDGIISEKYNKKSKNKILKEIIDFENTLTDSGILIIKVYLDISKKEQNRRCKKMEKSNSTKWKVEGSERVEWKEYDKYSKKMKKMIEISSISDTDWKVVNSDSQDEAMIEIFEYIIEKIERKLSKNEKKFEINPYYSGEDYIEELNIKGEIEEEEYKKEIKKYQERLRELEYIIYKKRIPVVIVYEGCDAAGKGGNIRRVVEKLDPRGYEVVPIAAPSEEEKKHHYLWRFWKKFPKAGHITIFDRSWYGRVLVEKVEGFCRVDEWNRAYEEINRMEKSIYDSGAVIIKFWMQIDKDEQLARFQERETTPYKNWKITEEDWRNREKWDEYSKAANMMIEFTSTEYAPWNIINCNCKMTARLNALKEIIKRIEEIL